MYVAHVNVLIYAGVLFGMKRQVYLPTSADYVSLQQRMCTIVARVLAHHLTFFNDQVVERHLKHHYSAESALKSELVYITAAFYRCKDV